MVWLIKKLYKLLDSNSWQGLLETSRKWREKIYWRWVFCLDKKFFGVNMIVKKWMALENKIAYTGLPNVSRELLKILKLKIKISKDISKWTEKKRGVIFLGLNHESIIEPILAYSIFRRKDIKLISGVTFARLGKNFAKNVLPVMERRYAWNYQKSSIIRFGGNLYRAENLSLGDINRINLRAFMEASSLLEKGGGILLFATGGHGISAKWGYGIEEIIKRINVEKRKEVDIIPMYFKGLSRMEVIRRLRKAALNKNFKNLDLNLEVGDKLNLGDIRFQWEDKNRGLLSSWLRWKFLSKLGFAIEEVDTEINHRDRY